MKLNMLQISFNKALKKSGKVKTTLYGIKEC